MQRSSCVASAPASMTTNVISHHILQIPREIRERIYKHVFSHSDRDTGLSPIPGYTIAPVRQPQKDQEKQYYYNTSLLLTCRQIYVEAKTIFFTHTTFDFGRCFCTGPALLRHIGPKKARLINHIHGYWDLDVIDDYCACFGVSSLSTASTIKTLQLRCFGITQESAYSASRVCVMIKHILESHLQFRRVLQLPSGGEPGALDLLFVTREYVLGPGEAVMLAACSELEAE